MIWRSVPDSARALDVLAGPQAGDFFVIGAPSGAYTAAMQRPSRRLRIGFTTASPIHTAVHAEAVAAVHDAASLLESLGHPVEEAAPAIDGAQLSRNYLAIYFGQVPADMAKALALGAKVEDFELLARVIETLGKAMSAATLTAQLAQWNDHARALAGFHQHFDLRLMPTLARPPLRHGEGDPPSGPPRALEVLNRSGLLGWLARRGQLELTIAQIASDSLRFVPFTQLAKLTGTPAMSVPLYWTADGLLLSVQCVAPSGQGDLLLQLAARLGGKLRRSSMLGAVQGQRSSMQFGGAGVPAAGQPVAAQQHPQGKVDPARPASRCGQQSGAEQAHGWTRVLRVAGPQPRRSIIMAVRRRG